MSSNADRDVANKWDANAAKWADDVRAGQDRFRDLFTFPRFLEFLPDLRGSNVVDLGCGEGLNTRRFAHVGMRMTGVDISAQMIDLARREEAREPLGIRYEVESSAELKSFADNSFDAAVSTMALMDTPDLPEVIRATFRIIRPGGGFYFSVMHPCFATRGSDWAMDALGTVTGRLVRNYWDEEPYIEEWGFNPDTPPFSIRYFPYRLEEYINGLCDAGFRIERIHEPRPTAELVQAHPEWSFIARVRDHTPFVLFVGARKI
jgi:SAM-dependent methyltransferase